MVIDGVALILLHLFIMSTRLILILIYYTSFVLNINTDIIIVSLHEVLTKQNVYQIHFMKLLLFINVLKFPTLYRRYSYYIPHNWIYNRTNIYYICVYFLNICNM